MPMQEPEVRRRQRRTKGEMVGDAQRAYWRDRKRNILLLANVLFRFRKDPHNAIQLIDLHSELEALKPNIISPDFDGFYQSHWIGRAERLATQFAWMSQQSRLPEDVREQLAYSAGDICDTVLESGKVPKEGPDAHFYFRLLLTAGEMRPRSTSAESAIEEVARKAHIHIWDARELAFVYVRLGELIRREAWEKGGLLVKAGGIRSGIRWRLTAVFMRRRLPIRARAKAFGSLFGAEP